MAASSSADLAGTAPACCRTAVSESLTGKLLSSSLVHRMAARPQTTALQNNSISSAVKKPTASHRQYHIQDQGQGVRSKAYMQSMLQYCCCGTALLSACKLATRGPEQGKTRSKLQTLKNVPPSYQLPQPAVSSPSRPSCTRCQPAHTGKPPSVYPPHALTAGIKPGRRDGMHSMSPCPQHFIRAVTPCNHMRCTAVCCPAHPCSQLHILQTT